MSTIDLAQGKCVGRWELFDSDDPDDHEYAKALCEACPVLEACRRELDRAMADALYAGFGPTGTWAGLYIGRHRSKVGAVPKRKRAKCGTASGAKRHKRMGEPVCEPCAEARRRYVADHRQRKLAEQEKYGVAS